MWREGGCKDTFGNVQKYIFEGIPFASVHNFTEVGHDLNVKFALKMLTNLDKMKTPLMQI